MLVPQVVTFFITQPANGSTCLILKPRQIRLWGHKPRRFTNMMDRTSQEPAPAPGTEVTVTPLSVVHVGNTESYCTQASRWPTTGRVILAAHDADRVVV